MTAADRQAPSALSLEGVGGGMAQTRKQQQQVAAEDKDRAQPVRSKSNSSEFPNNWTQNQFCEPQEKLWIAHATQRRTR
jgi:hypothetical protein